MAQNTSMEEFEALLNESFEMDTPNEGSVVKGKVIAIEAGQAIIDVGYKMEGRVELKEFANPGEQGRNHTGPLCFVAPGPTNVARFQRGTAKTGGDNRPARKPL